MEYKFNKEGQLLPQRILKCALAFFYGKTPRHFRRKLAPILCSRAGRYYTPSEVKKIFNHFDVVYQQDVENAIPKINEYLRDERIRNKKRFLIHCQKK